MTDDDATDPHAAQFRRLCRRIAKLPNTCPEDAERDLMLRAAKEVFCTDGCVREALRVQYARNGMLRALVDAMIDGFAARRDD